MRELYVHTATLVLLTLSMLLVPAAARSEEPAGHAHDELGSVSFPISCDPEAQADFERAVALLHHMMYVEARGAFRAITEAHPECRRLIP